MTLVITTTVGPVSQPTVPEWRMDLVPVEPLEERWYALVHVAPPDEGTVLLGTPLAGGGVVGRIFGVAVPEVHQILGSGNGDIRVNFTHHVFPDGEHTETDIVQVRQGSALCETQFLGPPMLLGDSITVHCEPSLDWALPVEVNVVGAVSESGRLVDPVAITHTFDNPNADGLRVLDLESTLAPPPVPTALCAGVDCA